MTLTRDAMWRALDGEFDLLIVGGGINGAGIAREAAKRGLKVAMIEMNDLAWATSSSSSKLVHGGIRYLEQLEFSLVFEAVSERRILLDIAPHLVNPLGFLFPVFKQSRHKLFTINAGMWLYEGLSLFRSPKRHKSLRPAQLAKEEPCLKQEDLKGAPLYYDCSTDDARLTLENAIDAAQHGAVILTQAKVAEFLRDDHGRLQAARVTCQLSGQTRQIKASCFINATGPWTDSVLGQSQEGDTASLLRPTKGVHIVVDRPKLPVQHAVVCFHPEDGRVLFAIPWGDKTYLGTTDTDYQGDPGLVAADLSDVDYLLEAAANYFPHDLLTRDDVISTWAGLRPLIAPVSKTGEVDESAVSREHQIVVGKNGLITIAGGKLTTYRKMSKEVVDTAVKMMRLTDTLPPSLTEAHTDRDPLPGAVGWPEDDDHQKVADQIAAVVPGLLDGACAMNLANTYGMLGMELAALVRENPSLAQPLVPGRPEILAQVTWAVEREFATSLDDIFSRRTQLFYRDQDQALGACALAADLMAQLLDWSPAKRQEHLQAYQMRVARSRAWQHEAG